jgi:gliding motility-associated-like protein
MRLFYTIIPIVCLLANDAFSQNNDCINAEVICSSSQISYNPSGPGLDDFSDPDNDNGCLVGDEHQSAWYYFEFQDDMPLNSTLEFVITPNAGSGEDYDFAIYGPDPQCGDLGEPVRCSFANSFCFYCPQTGLGNGSADFSEPPSGDGFVAPLIVNPGEGYYLLVDNYDNSSQGFDLAWGGGAAPYLDCSATPECNIVLTEAGPLDLCPSPAETPMPVTISGTEGNTTYTWTATNGGASFLSSSTVATPSLTIPSGTSGSFTFTLTVSDEICDKSIDVVVNITASINVEITGEEDACEGDQINLSVSSEFSSYQWSSGASGSTITVAQSGNYSVQVTDNSGCIGTQSTDITFHPLPEPEITGDATICEGESAYFDVGSGYVDYDWSNGGNQQSINPTSSNLYSVTVTDINGCEGSDALTLSVMPQPIVAINGEDFICKGENSSLIANPGMASYEWTTGAQTPLINITDGGTYGVLITDLNGCSGSGNFTVHVSEMEIEFTSEDPTCYGEDNGFIRVDEVKGGLEPYQLSWDGGLYGSTNIISPLSAGVYNLNILDAAGCEYEEDFNIYEGFDLMLNLGEDQFIRLGDEVQINAQVNIPDAQIANLTWIPEDITSCINCLDFNFLPLGTTTINAFVEDDRGCKTEHQVTIFVDKEREVFIPNAFSPNDDGVNDVLVIYAGKDVSKINSFRIFSRWGNPVFEMTDFYPNDPSYGWNGKTSEMMNSSAFIYSADVEFIDGSTKQFMGDFVLLK